MRLDASLLWLLALLGGCSTTAKAPATADAGNAPASASDECTPAGPHDASAFVYTATCALPADDAGAMTSCQQWSESADGDWTPFLETCAKAGGAITATPCADAGVVGVCILAASCTTQTSVFQYGAAGPASARVACEASAGATFVP